MTKYTIDGNVICPFCKVKNYFVGNSLKKCKHLQQGYFDKVSLKHKWVFDPKAKGFKPNFTIKHMTPQENKYVQPTGRMSKMFNRI